MAASIAETTSIILSWLGMLLILLAFILETQGRIHSRSKQYLVLMAIGSGLLLIRAVLIEEWAFSILELVWCLAAISGLVKPKPQAELLSETQ